MFLLFFAFCVASAVVCSRLESSRCEAIDVVEKEFVNKAWNQNRKAKPKKKTMRAMSNRSVS